MWDVFISHAREDKADVARPLAVRLQKSGLAVWIDEQTLALGDSLREKIDEGLSQSRYGVLILSPSFFAKRWPRKELDGLFSREETEGKVILPVWHNISAEVVAQASPLLAGRLAASTRDGIDSVAESILAVVRPDTLALPPTVDDLFDRDASISMPAADRLAADESVDLAGIVAALRGLNPVTTLAARTYLARVPDRSAPLMVGLVVNAHRDWHAATLVPDCFHPTHRRYCEDELAKLARDSDEPDVARKAIESLGFLGASGWGWSLFERLKGSSGYYYDKLEYYVVLAIARMFQLRTDEWGWHQSYVSELRNLFDTLERTIRLAAEHGWRSTTFGSLMDVLALCPIDRADLFLGEWLASDHPDLRRLAARSLGQMRLRRTVPYLIDRLEDAASRHEVLMALGNIGGADAVSALTRVILEDGPDGAAGAALSAATETVEDPLELQRIADMLLDKGVSEECFVYRGMGINGDSRFSDRVRRGLDHRDPTVRAHSALAFARLAGETAIKRLREMLREAGSPMERSLIAAALLVASRFELDTGLVDQLRVDLRVESYMYKRLTRDDLLGVLRACPSEQPRRMADAWSRVYATMPDY